MKAPLVALGMYSALFGAIPSHAAPEISSLVTGDNNIPAVIPYDIAQGHQKLQCGVTLDRAHRITGYRDFYSDRLDAPDVPGETVTFSRDNDTITIVVDAADGSREETKLEFSGAASEQFCTPDKICKAAPLSWTLPEAKRQLDAIGENCHEFIDETREQQSRPQRHSGQVIAPPQAP